MTFERLWHSFRLCIIHSAPKRAEYCQKNNIYANIGNNVSIMLRKVPLYPNLIYFHNNIRVGPGVLFITHDTTHLMMNRVPKEVIESISCDMVGQNFQEKIGCIEIMDNVFIGANCTILYNTRIGPNAIVGSGSVIVKDVPPNTIVSGVPAKVIGSFDKHYLKRLNEKLYPEGMKPIIGRTVGKDLAEHVWKEFRNSREETGCD